MSCEALRHSAATRSWLAWSSRPMSTTFTPCASSHALCTTSTAPSTFSTVTSGLSSRMRSSAAADLCEPTSSARKKKFAPRSRPRTGLLSSSSTAMPASTRFLAASQLSAFTPMIRIFERCMRCCAARPHRRICLSYTSASRVLSSAILRRRSRTPGPWRERSSGCREADEAGRGRRRDGTGERRTTTLTEENVSILYICITVRIH